MQQSGSTRMAIKAARTYAFPSTASNTGRPRQGRRVNDTTSNLGFRCVERTKAGNEMINAR